jgi:hypothetical protein
MSIKVTVVAALALLTMSAPAALADIPRAVTLQDVAVVDLEEAPGRLFQQTQSEPARGCRRLPKVITLQRTDGQGYDRILVTYVVCGSDTPEQARQRANSTVQIVRVLPRPSPRNRDF